MDGPRPILPAELAFFTKGTGKGKYLLLKLASTCPKIYDASVLTNSYT